MKKNKLLPAIKKDIKYFLFSEEARVSKKNIARIGMGLTMLGLMFDVELAHGHVSSFFNDSNRGGHSSHSSHGSHGAHGSHTSHSSHVSHGSHSSHSSHGAHGAHGSHGSHCNTTCDPGGWNCHSSGPTCAVW